jgi:hypothetical protein
VHNLKPGNVIEIEFENGVVNTVFYITSKTSGPLKQVYQTFKAQRSSIEQAMWHVPYAYLHVDNLAGGEYIPFGFGSIPPGPKGCPKSYQPEKNGRSHQIPFLRQTAQSNYVVELSTSIGAIQGP